MVGTWNSLDEMLDAHYSSAIKKEDLTREIKKALATTSTGVFNTIYGAGVWAQLNQETKVFGLLPKYPRARKGIRVCSARPSALAGATAEGGDVAAADDATYAAVAISDKLQQITYQYSEFLSLFENQDDSIKMDDIRRQYANFHVEGIESSMNVDGDTLAADAFESIDRVTASHAHATAASWTTGDEDIYGIDRSGNAWADAQVGHNSATDRDLTISLMRGVLYDCRKAGGMTNLIITGYDTHLALINLLQAQQRYVEYVSKVGVDGNGVMPAKTGEGGVSTLAFDGVPVFPNARTQADTISRVYFLDTTDPEGLGEPRLGFRLGRPPTNIESTDFIKNGAFAIKGNYSTVGELVCTFLAAQGSLRDLK